MNSQRIVQTEKAPAAIGPYSQAIIANGFVFTAGQIPLDPASGQLVDGDVGAQTERAVLNLKEVLEAAGSSLAHVVKTNVFLRDMNDFSDMNAVYETFFASSRPARSTIEAGRLPRDCAVEIECVAIVPST